MNDTGLFRTKIFGGFNKKDVFEYFEILKSQAQDENLDLFQKCEQLAAENDSMEEKVSQFNEKENELKTRICELETENSDLNKKIAELNDNSDKIKALEEQNSSLSEEIFKLNSLLIEENKYKSRYEELSRKVLKIESELILKDSVIKKTTEKYAAELGDKSSELKNAYEQLHALKNAVLELPSVNEDSMLEAKTALNALAHVLGESNKLIESINSLKTEVKE